MHRFYYIFRGLIKDFFYTVIFSVYSIKVLIDSLLHPNQEMKIFVTGFKHSGTSILRKIIGNHENIKDILNEVSFRDIMKPNTTGGISVMKYPNCDRRVFKACLIAKNVKIVCILKDPRDVLVSLEKRDGGVYSIEKFIREWCEYVENSIAISKRSNGYLVRYEDLFKNDFRAVKRLFDWLGIHYTESIITKNKDRKVSISTDIIPSEEPLRTEHALFRSYQINQEFKQMSGQYLKELSKDKKDFLESDPCVGKFMKILGYM